MRPCLEKTFPCSKIQLTNLPCLINKWILILETEEQLYTTVYTKKVVYNI
jgi:hypothetical protein